MKTENRNKLIELFNNTRYLNDNLSLNDILNYNDINTLEDLQECLNERIQAIEIIYFSNAINILKEEDQSLTESLEQAHEFCYNLTDINSELLATLLIQKRCFEELSDFIQEVEENEIFND